MRRRLAFFLTCAGLLLLIYVCSEYWQMYAGQRKLALEWQQQSAQPEVIPASDKDSLVRLTIAKINLDAVVVEGTSRKSLKLGPGHMENSARPDLPETRSSSPTGTLFSVTSTSCARGMRLTSGDGAKSTNSKLQAVVWLSPRIFRPYSSLLRRA